MDWVLEIGCGWLGWHPDSVRYMHLADVHLAYNGKIKMLQSCYGTGEKKEEARASVNRKPATLDNFDDIMGWD